MCTEVEVDQSVLFVSISRRDANLGGAKVEITFRVSVVVIVDAQTTWTSAVASSKVGTKRLDCARAASLSLSRGLRYFAKQLAFDIAVCLIERSRTPASEEQT